MILVLCGRGGYINKHLGNIIYRRVVEFNKNVYRQVPKRHRMLVSRSIVQAIFNAGGRFLQEKQSTARTEWTEIQLRRAVQKTSQALRERSDGTEVLASIATSEEAKSLRLPEPIAVAEVADGMSWPTAPAGPEHNDIADASIGLH